MTQLHLVRRRSGIASIITSYLFLFSSLGACGGAGPRVSKRKSHSKSHKKKQRQDKAEKLKKAGIQTLLKASWGRVVRRVEAVVINVDLAFTLLRLAVE